MSGLVCAGCGRDILGAFVTALGAHWHPEHFVCGGCGRPIAESSFVPHGGAAWHAACFAEKVAPRCAYCRKPLIGPYFEDAWGARYCVEHRAELPPCHFCGRLVPPRHLGSQAGGAEHVACPICRASAIHYVAQARPLFQRLVRWINDEGLRFNDLALHIELRDRPGLAAFLRRPGDPQCLGATLHAICRNGPDVWTDVKGVAILCGLPSMLFQGITVHELGHAWLAVHLVIDLPQIVEEGFCRLLEHRFYAQDGSPAARFYADQVALDPDPVYGDGYRRMQAVSDSYSFGGLLDSLRTTRKPPTDW